MEYHPKSYEQLIGSISSAEGEPSRSDLAEFMSFVVAQENSWVKINELMREVEVDKREDLAAVLNSVSSEVGWEKTKEIFTRDLSFLRKLRPPKNEGAPLYPTLAKSPDEINDASDFNEPSEGIISYWIPEKKDIRRFISIASMGHSANGRTGPIRIVDVGGGSGFVSKLIADEAKTNGIDLEITVVDPDAEKMKKAEETYADTPNLHFKEGDALMALRDFGPELAPDKRKEFDELEEQRLRLVANSREELAQIRAIQMAIESASALAEVIQSPLGARASGIFGDAGVDPTGKRYEALEKLAAHYESLNDELRQQYMNIRNRQEEIYAACKPEDGKVDMVYNSWMPMGLDFTRELRWISAPSIVYARLSSGGCGFEDYRDGDPGNFGKEESFESGPQYEDVDWWRNYSHDGGPSDNIIEVQARKGFTFKKDVMDQIKVPPADRYRWERTLPKTDKDREIMLLKRYGKRKEKPSISW